MTHIGYCIHCGGPAYRDEDNERTIFKGLPGCLCEIILMPLPHILEGEDGDQSVSGPGPE